MLISSRASLQHAGLFDAYERNLDTATRTLLREMLASVWMPVTLAMEHYATRDGLLLSRATQRRAHERYTPGNRRAVGSHGRDDADDDDRHQMPRFWGRVFDSSATTRATSTGSSTPKGPAGSLTTSSYSLGTSAAFAIHGAPALDYTNGHVYVAAGGNLYTFPLSSTAAWQPAALGSGSVALFAGATGAIDGSPSIDSVANGGGGPDTI